jgi:carboxylate-amine ligase
VRSLRRVEPAAQTHGSTPADVPFATSADRARGRFDAIASLTLGAEEELLLVDPESFAPLPEAEWALLLTDGDGRLGEELRACQVEAITPICVSVADVRRELASIRTLLSRRLAGRALVVAAGTHPLTEDPGPISSSARHTHVALEHPWAVPRLLTCGLHVHVALGGAERALAVHNAFRSYLPLLTAVAANAPFHEGRDSGLATVRPRLNESLPRTGIPPAFASWEAWGELLDWGRAGQIYPDATYQWWDLRLHPGHGTLEVRAPDAQLRVDESATIVALVQALVAWLADRHDEGGPLPVHPTERIAENRRLAARDGLAGTLPDQDTGTPRQTRAQLEALVEQLLPTAAQLGCEAELAAACQPCFEGGAARQRRFVAELGLQALLPRLAAETISHEPARPPSLPVPTA